MRNKTILYLTAAVFLLFCCSFLVSADRSVFVNDAASKLSGVFSEHYAIGSGGTQRLGYDDIYAITSHGLASVSSMNAEGGGGLLYEDGSVRISSDVIKVGLSFNFNRGNMDSTVETAAFSNITGGGFSFGYYDNDRVFVELSETEESTIFVSCPEEGSLYLCVCDGSGEVLYETAHPNTKDNFIAIHPRSSDGSDVLTRYDTNRYYGDFEVGFTAGSGITVINTVPIEQYVRGVITAEMVAGAPLDAYKAQAVTARTYAQRCIRNTDLYDYYGFDLTNNTYYQAYYGYFVPGGANYNTIDRAVRETAGEYLTYNGSLINAMYGAANGGETADGGYPYLKSFEDPYEGAAWTKGRHGHGCGMSQWGAYAMAKNYNKDYKSILGFYYTKVGISHGYI